MCHEEDISIQPYSSVLFPWVNDNILEDLRKRAALVKKVLDLGRECETGGFTVFKLNLNLIDFTSKDSEVRCWGENLLAQGG